jgi:hypothetical protein
MRFFAIAASLLAATAGPAAVSHHLAGHAPSGTQAVVASTDSTLCNALHTAMHSMPGHAAPDSTTMAALHTLMSAHDGQATLDSAQMAAIHSFHTALMQSPIDSATHETLKGLMHSSTESGAPSDSHAALHNAMMACMQHG